MKTRRRISATVLLSGVGRRLGRYPRLAGALLRLGHRLPSRLRRVVVASVTTPVVDAMRARLDIRIEGGGRMLVDTGDVIGRVLATSGVWEPHVTAVVRRMLAPGDVFADVGANIGYFTLLASRLVGESGRVHALEPSPGVYATLLANLEHNAISNVVAHQVAAGAATGQATLRDAVVGTNRGASSLRGDPERGWGVQRAVPVSVAVRPLAGLIPAEDWPRLRLIKIDVEGFEADVLRGIEQGLEQGHRPAIVVEVHTDIDAGAAGSVAAFAARHGLRVQRIVDRQDLDRIRAASNPLLEDVGELGLATAQEPRVDVLLSAAPGRGAG